MIKNIIIDGIKADNRYFLAPMAGITDSAYRQICRSFGAGMTYTEMVSAKALTYGDKKSLSLLKIDDIESSGVDGIADELLNNGIILDKDGNYYV